MLYIASCSVALAMLLAGLSMAGDLMPSQMITVGNKRCKLESGCQSRSDWLKDDDWKQCGDQKYPNRCRAKCDGFDYYDKNGPCKSCSKDPSYQSPKIDLPCVASDCAMMPRQTDCPDCDIYQECCAGDDGKCGWNIYPHSDHRYLRCLASCGKSGYPTDGKSGSPSNWKGSDFGKSGNADYGKSGGSKYYDSKDGMKSYDGGKADYGMSGKHDYGKQGGYGGHEGQPGMSGMPGMPGKDDYGKQGMQGMPGYDEKKSYDKSGKSDYGMPGKGDYGKQGMQGMPGKDGMSGYHPSDGSKGYGPSDGGKSDYGMPQKDDYKGHPAKDGHGSGYDDKYDAKPGYGWSGKQGDGKYGSDGGNKANDGYSPKDDGKTWPTIKV